jgi:hypothetical protein
MNFNLDLEEQKLIILNEQVWGFFTEVVWRKIVKIVQTRKRKVEIY